MTESEVEKRYFARGYRYKVIIPEHMGEPLYCKTQKECNIWKRLYKNDGKCTTVDLRAVKK